MSDIRDKIKLALKYCTCTENIDVIVDKVLAIPIGGEVKDFIHTDKGTRMSTRLRTFGDVVEEGK